MRRADDSRFVNNHNVVATLMLRCNHDVKPIVCSSRGPSLAFYVTKYITKGNGQQLRDPELLGGAIARMRARHPAVATATTTTTIGGGANASDNSYAFSSLLSLVNAATKVVEVSGVAAAYSILAHVSCCCQSLLRLVV